MKLYGSEMNFNNGIEEYNLQSHDKYPMTNT